MTNNFLESFRVFSVPNITHVLIMLMDGLELHYLFFVSSLKLCISTNTQKENILKDKNAD